MWNVDLNLTIVCINGFIGMAVATVWANAGLVLLLSLDDHQALRLARPQRSLS
jgi:hypothetical protein